MMPRPGGIIMAVLVLALVTGCTAPLLLHPPHAGSGLGVPSQKPGSRRPPSPLPSARPSSTVAATALNLATPIPGEILGGDQDFYAVDNGPIRYARGQVRDSRSGVPLSYRVAAGDTETGIGARFGLNFEQLIQLNSIRRCSLDYSSADVLYVGDILNLDPHTLLGVGTEQGRVCHGTLPSPLPPQKSPSAAYLSP
jgi:hypothetical protein